MPSTDADVPDFTTVDWEATDTRRTRMRRRTAGFLVVLVGLVALFVADYYRAVEWFFDVFDWNPTRMDWLFLFAAAVSLRYAVAPLLFDRERTAPYVREFLGHPWGVVSLAYLLAVGVLGLLGPDWFGLAHVDYQAKIQPPVFTSVYAADIWPYNCVGRMVDGWCHGTWQYPLGTTRVGEDVGKLVLYGLHLGLKLGLSAAVLMVVVATAAGVTAGYYGGVVDDLLMGYVDVQQTIPAVVLYLVLASFYLGKGLFALALVFGLFDWGGIARLVRSETLKRRSAGFVRAARSAGASDLQVVRRHVVPNATPTIVTTLTRQIPVLILIQIALAYLKLNRVNVRSLGEVLLRALTETPVPWLRRWWVAVTVVLAVVVTVLAFNALGDALRDVLDTREEGV